MFLEQVLHIMLDQDCSRSLCYFRPQMNELLHYAILGKMEKMGKKLCKRLQNHRLNSLNNALDINYIVEHFLRWGIHPMTHLDQFSSINSFQNSTVFLPV